MLFSLEISEGSALCNKF